MAVHTQGPRGEKIHPMVVEAASAGYPTVLVMDHIGSAVDHNNPVDPTADSSREATSREAGIGSVGDRGVEGVDQQDGSNLTWAVGHSCLHRTYKPPRFRISSKREITGGYTKSCSCGREGSKSLVRRTKGITLLCVILLYPARWQRARICQE